MQYENEHQEDHERHRYHHHLCGDVLTNAQCRCPASMPPPPMPASLDPTTVSSTKPSLNVNHINQHHQSHLATPSISPLTSFANLSLLSPALLGSTPPPPSSLSFPLPLPPNSTSTTTVSPGVIPPGDHSTPWSPLRRYTTSFTPLSTTSLPSLPVPVPVSSSSHVDDPASVASSPSSPTNLANHMDYQPIESSSCTPSPPLSPSSPQPEMLRMDSNNEIQSTPHSPDPTWRADSPSGDHINPCPSESQSEILVKGLDQRVTTNGEERWELPVFDVKREDLGVSPSHSASPASPVLPGDTIAVIVDCSGRDEGENPTLENPNHINLNQSNPPAHLQSSSLDELPLCEPSSTSLPLSQSLLPDPATSSSSQPNPIAQYQQVAGEEESRLESSPEHQPPHPPPAPKVKMSLRDFALRKKKQREEQKITESAPDSSSSGVDSPFISGGVNGKQVNRVEGKGDEGPSNGEDGIIAIGLKKLELEMNLVDGLKRDISCQGASPLSRPMVQDDVVDVPGPSTKQTTPNGYHAQQQPSILPASSALLAARIQAGTSPSSATTSRQTKQEVIEQPIPAATTNLQPISMDTTRYAAVYNNFRSISPINPDPHHFQSYSPRLCQEDGEIAEIMDTPPLPPSLSPSSLPLTPLATNRSAPTVTTVPSSGSLPRGLNTKRADLTFTRSGSSSSSSQVRHSPPTHPRSFNASPPCRQPSSAPTPPPAPRGTGVPPTAPRALRQSMLSNRPTPTTPTAMASSPYPSTASNISTATATPTSSTSITTSTSGRFPPYIPRGPSADRDRGWDTDQMQYPRSLLRRDLREGGHAWGGR